VQRKINARPSRVSPVRMIISSVKTLRAKRRAAWGVVKAFFGIDGDECGGEGAFAEEAAEEVGDLEGDDETIPDGGAEVAHANDVADEAEDSTG